MIGNYFFSSSGAAAYEIEQSLRFDRASSHYLNETFAAGQSTWTLSLWVKRANLTGAVQCMFGTSTNGYYNDLAFDSSDRLRFRQVYSGVPSENFEMLSSMRFRDPSAWYHIVLSYCTHGSCASGPAADRAKIWVNNQRLTAFDATAYPGANVSSLINANNRVHNIGKVGYYDDYLGAYIAEFNFIDGQLLEPDDFGEEDDNGVWRPIRYTGTYGNNNSVYLKFDPSATNGIGHDHSGNGNNFTASGFTTSGTGTDVMSDTPTTNWCTLNPLSYGPSNADMVEGNLRFNQPTSTTGNAKGTIAVSSGKWYWEVTPQTTATANVAGGILGAAETSTSSQPGNYATGYSYYSTGETRHNGVDATYGASYGAGDVIGTALDLDAGTLVFYKNGVSQGTAYSSVSGTFVPAIGDTSTGSGSQLVCNFGQRAFAYTPPTGFKALNTSNLPAPDIADGSKYFSTTLYTGVSGSQSVDAGMATDLAWIKSRSTSQSHSLTDRVRGNDLVLQSNETSAETSGDIDLTSTGVTIGNNNALRNAAGVSYVLWSWLAGGSGSSNTDGSITSTVSANPSAGFSIVGYTGDGTQFATIGHGLGVAPKMIIVKNRSSAVGWAVLHTDAGTTGTTLDGAPEYKMLSLNSTAAASDFGSDCIWNPTSTTFKVAATTNSNWVNQNGSNHIAYCFAEVEGYSKFGSFVGNSSDDGVFIYLGFKPKWLLLKSAINTADDWIIMDVDRSPYNVMNDHIVVQQSAAEVSNSTETNMDFLSNGIKLRDSNGKINASGSTYIYAAFAENPFGGSGVSPATAR